MYDESDYGTTTKGKKKNKNRSNSFVKKNIGIISIIGILIIVVIFLMLFKGCSNNNDKSEFALIFKEIELSVGNTLKLEYKIDDNNAPIINWTSENALIASVNEEGVVTALEVGNTVIVASYENSDGIKKDYCVVNVIENENNNNNDNDNTNPLLKVNFVNGDKDKWHNKDVELEVQTSDDSNKVEVKYAINCTNNCQYKKLNGNKLVIKEEGNNILNIIASDPSNNKTEIEVPVKIDKTNPRISLDEKIVGIVYTNTSTREICATCEDEKSGCKESKVCKKITKTENDVTIDVFDNAGNKSSTQSFNIIYDNAKPTCSLTVDSSGNLTATYSDDGGSGLAYYGFSSSHTGDNVTSMKVGTGTHTYYVKDKAGNINTCNLEVKQKSTNCVCPEGYSVISQYSTSKCLKLLGIADWGDWIFQGQETVDECTTTCFNVDTSSCVQCGKITVGSKTRYAKNTYTRTRAVCPSGGVIYNGSYCYSERYKICNTSYYS